MEAGKREKEIEPPTPNVAPQDASPACVLQNATMKRSSVLLAKAAKTYIRPSAQRFSVMLQCFSDGPGSKRRIGLDASSTISSCSYSQRRSTFITQAFTLITLFNSASTATPTTPKTDDGTGRQRTRLWLRVSPQWAEATRLRSQAARSPSRMKRSSPFLKSSLFANALPRLLSQSAVQMQHSTSTFLALPSADESCSKPTPATSVKIARDYGHGLLLKSDSRFGSRCFQFARVYYLMRDLSQLEE
ncbi:hypothetical protein BKA70DRAFT_1231437 [Coprinopsis sp. MPI-PUGE-AT-0042]|nr:hypothetical protein BKA70DRAFT_1231437 [Coprinopsis sp. MPI-PUGE-AT-0042]